MTMGLLEFDGDSYTSVRTGTTPLTSAGGKASNRPRTLTARQIPIYLFAAESR